MVYALSVAGYGRISRTSAWLLAFTDQFLHYSPKNQNVGKMRGASLTEQMSANSQEVFELLHDYSRRLEWDTLLLRANLTRGHTKAEKGATSLCVGRPFFGIFGMETRYLTYKNGQVAAVKLINNPPFFDDFAASIRHEDNDAGSTACYSFRFSARPRILRWLLEPLMLMVLKVETKKRLKALSEFVRKMD